MEVHAHYLLSLHLALFIYLTGCSSDVSPRSATPSSRGSNTSISHQTNRGTRVVPPKGREVAESQRRKAANQSSTNGSDKPKTGKSHKTVEVRKFVSPNGKHVVVFVRSDLGVQTFLYQDRRTQRVTFVKESTAMDGIWSPNSRYFLLTDHIVSTDQICEIYKVWQDRLAYVRPIDLGRPLPVIAKHLDHSWVSGIGWSRNSRCVYVEAGAHGSVPEEEVVPGEIYHQQGFYFVNALTGRLIRELTIDDIRREDQKYYGYWLWRKGKRAKPPSKIDSEPR